jgi:hypothetical protein
MWFLVQVVKGSRHYEPSSQIGNRVLISDTTEMVISGRMAGAEGFRFEARKGNDTFVLTDFPAGQSAEALASKFSALAEKMGAIVING